MIYSPSLSAIAANYPADFDSISYNDMAMLAAFMAGLPLLHQYYMLDSVIYVDLGTYYDLLIVLSASGNSLERQVCEQTCCRHPSYPLKGMQQYPPQKLLEVPFYIVMQHSFSGRKDVACRY